MPKKTPINLKNPKAAQAKEYVTELSFVENFTKIFMGDLDTKMKFTFDMYDFDNDEYITPEDIRIMMSYMPFQRNIQIQAAQKQIELNGGSSPVRNQRQRQKEGLYQDEEGRNLGYHDRERDQEEIKQFLESIFSHGNSEHSPVKLNGFQQLSPGLQGRRMNFSQYDNVNKNVSSEMFYSLMAVLHEKLPCAKNFYRLRNNFRRKDPKYQQAVKENSSPIRTIASPKLIRGLSITKQQRADGADAHSKSPDVRIKSSKNGQNIVRKLSSKHSLGDGHNSQVLDLSVNLANQNLNFNGTMTQSKMMSSQNPPAKPQFQFLNRQSTIGGNGQQPASPHKLNKIHKFTRYEESKQDVLNLSALSHSKRLSNSNQTFIAKNPASLLSNKTSGANSPVKALHLANTFDDYGNPLSLQGGYDQQRGSVILLDDSPTKSPEKSRAAEDNNSSGSSPRNKNQVQPLQGFGNYLEHAKDNVVFESPCLLKTKTDRYKLHWCLLTGNELYCYRQRDDIEKGEAHRVMHSLIGTFIKEMPLEASQSEGCNLYPVKIVLPPNKSRLLYFKNEYLQLEWIQHLRNTIGHTNMFDFYDFKDDLGKG